MSYKCLLENICKNMNDETLLVHLIFFAIAAGCSFTEIHKNELSIHGLLIILLYALFIHIPQSIDI